MIYGFKVIDHTGGWFINWRKSSGIRSRNYTEELKRTIICQQFLDFGSAFNYAKSKAKLHEWDFIELDESDYLNTLSPVRRLIRKLLKI